MLQYKIPQNIGIEDKIVGPFSLRQLIILAIGGGISYTLFAITSRIYELNVIEYILIALPALFALAAAMLKIHNVTFIKYIFLMYEFAIKPKKRMWDHRGISALVAPDLRDKTAEDKDREKIPEKSARNVNLSQLSAMLDSGGFEHVQAMKHEDIDRVNDDDLITEAYFGHKKQESSTQNMYWRTRDVQKKKLDILAKIKVPAPASATVTSPVPAPSAPAAPPSISKTITVPTSATIPLPATKEARKETVTEQLAKVITKARQNNQIKNAAPTPADSPAAKSPVIVPSASKPVSIIPSAPTDTAKKKRKRHKKPKKATPPLRKDSPINTISDNKPEKAMQQPKPAEKETTYSDLSKGGEIEFNLD